MSRAPTPNDFDALGLRPGADDNEIRTAYRRLAKVHHPDRNPGDVEALATFRRLTDSYAALRSHAQARARADGSPLAAGRRRASSRRGTAEEVTALADLAVGSALWVDASAVLVGPDRAAALHPAAPGSAFPTADRVIRVERRDEGFHVFMPPQPSARWPLTVAAETEGLAVAALWVGDRQDDELGSAPGARVPLRLMDGIVGEIAVGERGWVAEEALAVDDDGNWTLDPAQPIVHVPHRATPVRVLRDEDGFRVHSDIPAAAWPPAAVTPGRAAVLTALLAGVTHPPASPLSA